MIAEENSSHEDVSPPKQEGKKENKMRKSLENIAPLLFTPNSLLKPFGCLSPLHPFSHFQIQQRAGLLLLWKPYASHVLMYSETGGTRRSYEPFRQAVLVNTLFGKTGSSTPPPPARFDHFIFSETLLPRSALAPPYLPRFSEGGGSGETERKEPVPNDTVRHPMERKRHTPLELRRARASH